MERSRAVLAAMLDSATGLRALAALTSGQTAVTRSLETRFLKPACVGPILAKAKVIEHTEREIVVEAKLVDPQGVTIAEATARLRVLEKK
jgi:uncharacterized protein (TIGR00369 family)